LARNTCTLREKCTTLLRFILGTNIVIYHYIATDSEQITTQKHQKGSSIHWEVGWLKRFKRKLPTVPHCIAIVMKPISQDKEPLPLSQYQIYQQVTMPKEEVLYMGELLTASFNPTYQPFILEVKIGIIAPIRGRLLL
jgi:hypothetical protein